MTANKPATILSTPETVNALEAQHMRDLFIKTHQHAAQQMDGARWHAIEKNIQDEITKGMADPTKLMAQHPNRLFVIRDGDHIIAYCCLQHKDDSTAELKNVVCSPDRQGEGLGRRLMQSVEQHARQTGYREITLWTYSHLQTATNMYVKRGYRHTGKTPPQHEPKILNPFHMSLDLRAH